LHRELRIAGMLCIDDENPASSTSVKGFVKIAGEWLSINIIKGG